MEGLMVLTLVVVPATGAWVAVTEPDCAGSPGERNLFACEPDEPAARRAELGESRWRSSSSAPAQITKDWIRFFICPN